MRVCRKRLTCCAGRLQTHKQLVGVKRWGRPFRGVLEQRQEKQDHPATSLPAARQLSSFVGLFGFRWTLWPSLGSSSFGGLFALRWALWLPLGPVASIGPLGFRWPLWLSRIALAHHATPPPDESGRIALAHHATPPPDESGLLLLPGCLPTPAKTGMRALCFFRSDSSGCGVSRGAAIGNHCSREVQRSEINAVERCTQRKPMQWRRAGLKMHF